MKAIIIYIINHRLIRQFFLGMVFAFVATGLKAQQLPLYSQYVMNAYMINPAVTGADGYTSFNLTARQQWLGFKNAPQTRSFSGQTRLLKKSYVIRNRNVNSNSLKPSTNGRVGLGGFIYSDRNGAVERMGLQGSYAYHIFLRETQLSFGISGGVFQFKIRQDELTYADPNDPIAGTLGKVIYVPDANLGLFVTNKDYYAGFSVNQLFQSYIKFGNQALEEYRMIRHYYLIGGYRIPLRGDFDFEPSTLLKATQNLSFQMDLGGKIYYQEDLWFGLTYRTSGAMIMMAGLRFNQFYFGYAFDYTLSSIQKYSFGSHEVSLALKLGDSARRYRWLQRY